jgi:hypothetical protein
VGALGNEEGQLEVTVNKHQGSRVKDTQKHSRRIRKALHACVGGKVFTIGAFTWWKDWVDGVDVNGEYERVGDDHDG